MLIAAVEGAGDDHARLSVADGPNIKTIAGCHNGR
jgi:hypothetical protein